MSTTAQQRVFAAVKARGYVDGWTEAQFVARQVCKLQEELGEVTAEIGPTSGMDDNTLGGIYRASAMAKVDLISENEWRHEWGKCGEPERYSKHKQYIAAELVDMQVVLFAAAERMGIDIVALAVEKAEADIERGVR